MGMTEKIYYSPDEDIILTMGGIDVFYAFQYGVETRRDAVVLKRGTESAVKSWLYRNGFRYIGVI